MSVRASYNAALSSILFSFRSDVQSCGNARAVGSLVVFILALFCFIAWLFLKHHRATPDAVQTEGLFKSVRLVGFFDCSLSMQAQRNLNPCSN